jgi:hypothetical protein
MALIPDKECGPPLSVGAPFLREPFRPFLNHESQPSSKISCTPSFFVPVTLNLIQGLIEFFSLVAEPKNGIKKFIGFSFFHENP